MSKGTGFRIAIGSDFDPRGFDRAEKRAQQLARRSIKESETMAGAWMRAGDKMQSIGAKFEGAGRSLTRNVTLPVLALGGAAVKAFADFEGAMTNSMSIMGDVSSEMQQKMETAARDVAKTMAVSHKEAAESYYFLASAGMTAEQSIAALPQVAAFAQAGMFDMARATDIATDAQSALGLASDDASENLANLTRVTDTLVGASTLANASVEQFGVALTTKAGTAMAQFNLELESGVAALAVFADQGTKADQAGTQLDATIRGLALAATNNAKAFEQYGIEIFDSAGNMRALDEITLSFEKSLGKMSDQQRSAALAQMGINKLTGQGVAMLMGSSATIAEYTEKLRQMGGVTQEVAEKQMASLTQQLRLLKDQFVDVAIDVGPIIVDEFLKPLMGYLQEFAGWLQELSPAQRRFAVQVAAGAAALGPMLILMGKLLIYGGKTISTLAGIAAQMPSIIAGAKSFTGALVGMQSATTASTLALASLGVGMAAGFVYLVRNTDAWQRNEEAVRRAAQTAVESGREQMTAWNKVIAPLSALVYEYEKGKAATDDYERSWLSLARVMSPGIAAIGDAAFKLGQWTGEGERADEQTDRLTTRLEAHIRAMDAAAAATDRLRDAGDKLRNAQVGYERADIRAEQAKIRVMDAQDRLREAIEKYGPKSREAERATLDLRSAELEAEDSARALNDARKEANEIAPADYEHEAEKIRLLGARAATTAGQYRGLNTERRTASSVAAHGGGTRGAQITLNARGAIYDRPTLGVFGEDGPEAIIPLSAKYRQQGLALLAESIKRMGFSGGGASSSPRPSAAAVAASVGGSPGGNTYYIDARDASDPADVERRVRRAIHEETRRSVSRGRVMAPMMSGG